MRGVVPSVRLSACSHLRVRALHFIDLSRLKLPAIAHHAERRKRELEKGLRAPDAKTKRDNAVLRREMARVSAREHQLLSARREAAKKAKANRGKVARLRAEKKGRDRRKKELEAARLVRICFMEAFKSFGCCTVAAAPARWAAGLVDAIILSLARGMQYSTLPFFPPRDVGKHRKYILIRLGREVPDGGSFRCWPTGKA